MHLRDTVRVRIFISSTRTGLEEERDALPGLIMALGHEPIMFEQFTAKTTPSREACLAAVQASDAYLLLLGPNYGWTWEETGLSATHEEYRSAQARGLPRIVFRKAGIEHEPEQQAFAKEVEAYSTGLFRASFSTTAQLLTEVTKAVRELEKKPEALSWRDLSEPIQVVWRSEEAGAQTQAGEYVLEVYIRPVTSTSRTATQLRSDAERIANVLRGSGAVSQSYALHQDSSAGRAVVEVQAVDRRRWDQASERQIRGAELKREGQVCIWQSLPQDMMGTLVDEASLASAAAEALRLAGLLGIVGMGGEVVVAAAIHPLRMLSIGDTSTIGHRNKASMPTYRTQEARTATNDAVTPAALDRGATEAGQELALRLLDALRQAHQW